MSNNVSRNILPAIAVMIAGLLGAWLVYDGFYSDNVTAVKVSQYEPAAGDEAEAVIDEEIEAEGDADEWEYFTDEGAGDSEAVEGEGDADVEVDVETDADADADAEADVEVETDVDAEAAE